MNRSDLIAILDRAGLRRVLAAAANLVRREQHFSVTADGLWVNRQEECTFVSPTIHTARCAEIHAWVLDTWCRGCTPRPGDTIVDVGAGIGEESVIFSRLVGANGRVIALEAHPRTFECLSDTLAQSGCQNVIPVHCAVGDRDGTAVISDTSDHLSNSIVGAADGLRVPQRTLDSLLAELEVDEVHFLKMNIEGAERLAIAGMDRTLGRSRDLCISCHDFVADATGDETFRTREQVRRALEQAGFIVSSREWTPDAPWLRDYLLASTATAPDMISR